MRQLAAEYDGRVRIKWAALALEVKNRRGTPKPILDLEVPVARQVEPALPIQAWARPDWEWPVTVLPAFEAVASAAEQGDAAAFAYQWAVRHAFFAESRCVSLRHVLLDVAREVGLDVERFLADFESGRCRRRVFDETRTGWEVLKVRGSPTLVLPNGRQYFAPAIPALKFDAEHRRLESWEPPDCPTGDCLDVLRGILDRAAVSG